MIVPSIKELYTAIRRDLLSSRNILGRTDQKQYPHPGYRDVNENETVSMFIGDGTCPASCASSTMQIVFVPSDGSATQYNGAVVKSHVAKLAAEKRRLKKEEQLYENLPQRVRGSQPSSRRPPRKRSTSESSSDSSSGSVNLAQDSKHEEPPLLFSSPRPMLWKGSSDPFNTTIVIMDASANALLSFNSDCFLPLIHSFERSLHKHVSYLNKFYQSSLDTMHDETTANANLARLAAILANRSPINDERRMLAARFAGQAYTSLRRQLANAIDEDRDKLKGQIFALFSAETLAGNFSAASLHMHTLQNLMLQDRREGRPIDVTLLQACSWQDILRSMLSGTVPIFKLENFVDLRLDILNGLATKLTELGLLQNNLLEESPEFPQALRPHLAKFRWLAHICGACPRVPRLVTPEINCSFADHATATMWKVNCVYFDAVDALKVGRGDRDTLYLTAVTALAGAYWIWADSGFDFLDPNNVGWKIAYSSLSPAQIILPKLLRGIVLVDQSTVPASRSLKLWLLYVASLAEQSVRNFAGSKAPGWTSNCYTAFVRQAASMDLVTWDMVEQILENFLYHPRTRPDDREWFKEKISAELGASTRRSTAVLL